ncbi:MAG: ribulose-phosphate 3-epimerase [Rhodothermales bacterium]
MILSPSIIASDFTQLGRQAREAVEAGAEWLHVDVMDGRFVPNITIGPFVVEALRPLAEETGVKLDVHLMIEEPGRYVDDFVDAGADVVTVHVEACTHLHRVLSGIRERGALAGVTLNPGTSLTAIEEVLPNVDLVLVMSVNPGFSGQKFIPASTAKIRRLRNMLNQIASNAYLEVDGGVGPRNIMHVVGAGANVIVAGNAAFGGDATIAENVKALREAVALEA